MKIAVVGLWHLGEVVAAGLSEVGHEIVAYDGNAEVVARCKAGEPPIEEPGIRERLGRIAFTTNPADLKSAEAIFLTMDTPVTEKDEPDTSSLFDTIKMIAPHLSAGALLVVMSQVPVGTTKLLSAVSQRPTAYVPENLQLGKALECFLKPDRTVIGADDEIVRQRVLTIFEKLPGERLIMSVASAEMSKHALNAWLATTLSFAYNISDLCEAVGADAQDVFRALKADRRIGNNPYLETGPGFSGGTLMRDLMTLESFAEKHRASAPVIAGAITTNRDRRGHLLKRLADTLGGSPAGRRVCLLGVTYKPGTPTLRQSLAIEIALLLASAGAAVTAADPMASADEFKQLTGASLVKDVYLAAKGCHAAILLTAWPEFASLDVPRLAAALLPPRVLFDTRNVYRTRADDLRAAGVQYVRLGIAFSC